jgi:hypothetical protein
MNRCEMRAYQSFGLTTEQFNNGIAKYQSSIEVQTAIFKIQVI